MGLAVDERVMRQISLLGKFPTIDKSVGFFSDIGHSDGSLYFRDC